MRGCLKSARTKRSPPEGLPGFVSYENVRTAAHEARNPRRRRQRAARWPVIANLRIEREALAGGDGKTANPGGAAYNPDVCCGLQLELRQFLLKIFGKL